MAPAEVQNMFKFLPSDFYNLDWQFLRQMNTARCYSECKKFKKKFNDDQLIEELYALRSLGNSDLRLM
jgi:hypothetical protein